MGDDVIHWDGDNRKNTGQGNSSVLELTVEFGVHLRDPSMH